MKSLFSIARVAAVAALTLGAGLLLTPAPAEAQNRHGFSHGGGQHRFAGHRAARPHMGIHRVSHRHMGIHRVSHRHRGFAPRAVVYRGGVHRSVRHVGWNHGQQWAHRPVRRHHNRYWPAAAGVGLGFVGATAFANSGYYHADGGYAPQQCWHERRTVQANYGHRVINVRVCPVY